jgi:hypothetical protein
VDTYGYEYIVSAMSGYQLGALKIMKPWIHIRNSPLWILFKDVKMEDELRKGDPLGKYFDKDVISIIFSHLEVTDEIISEMMNILFE